MLSGCDARAMDAWLCYADCCEKSNEMSSAAEGLQQAAFLSASFDQSMQLLQRADEFYKIGGYPDRGLTLMKKFARNLLEKETDEARKEALEIYEKTLMV